MTQFINTLPFFYTLIFVISLFLFIYIATVIYLPNLQITYTFMNTPGIDQQDLTLLNRVNPFGKHQKSFSFVVMLIAYQAPLFICIGLFAYSIIFFDYNVWISFLVICILQYPIGKSQTYIHFVNNYINPLLYFKSFKRYFQEKIPSEKDKCLFSFHPHGVLAYGLLANMNYQQNDAMSRMVGLSSRFILNVPFIGILMRLWGLQSVNPNNLKRLMMNKKNIGLLPGGFEQATLTTAKQLRIFIENRKGFIKYALKYNYTIYPTLILNEHQAFWTFDYWLNFRMKLNKLKMPGVFFFHPKTFFLYPPTVQFITVVGKGLKGRQYKDDQQPSGQEIDQMHKDYINEIKRVYTKYRHLNGDKHLVMF